MSATHRSVAVYRLLLVLVAGWLSATAAAQDAVIHAGGLLDVERGRLLPASIVRVENGRIVGIAPAADRPVPDNAIDLSAYTLLPGLIDAHVHLCDNSWLGDAWDPWTYPAPYIGIVCVPNAKAMLEAGFTTVRDVGEPYFAGVAIRDAIAENIVPGPRVVTSGPIISMTGGHADWGNWMAPPHNSDTPAETVADGEDEVRKAARTQIKYGVDWLKIAATGGFGSHGTRPGAAEYSVAEMRAAVEEASKRGLFVAAHAHGADGIRNAVEAGVRSIEHAVLMDADAIAAMKRRGVFLVPDLFAGYYDFIESQHDWSDKGFADGEKAYDDYAARVGEAYRAGVTIVFGTDAGVVPHARAAEQFALMVAAGMSPADAIRSATRNAALLLGLERELGSVETGRRADLIAVRGNPLDDVSVLTDVVFVMKGGDVYLSPATGSAEHRED